MCPLFEGFPAIIYGVLWILRTFRRLDKVFPNLPLKVVVLLTDDPPAFMVRVDKQDFEIKLLENINDPKDIDNIECDEYMVLSKEILYKGPAGIRDAIAENEAKLSNFKILTVLAKLLGVG